MTLDATISEVQNKLRKGLFPNEAAVSNGALLPILRALGWTYIGDPVSGTSVVSPEYRVEDLLRVDYAICPPNGQPVVFLEVKSVGNLDNKGKRQLFNYAFRRGVPLAVLTDGRKWNFYLTAGEGVYRDHWVYGLDLLRCDLSECSYRLNRYLSHEDVITGAALENARSDCRNKNPEQEIEQKLLQEYDRLFRKIYDLLLVEILADKVAAFYFLEPNAETFANNLLLIAKNAIRSVVDKQPKSGYFWCCTSQSNSNGQSPWFVLHGQRYQGRNTIEMLALMFEKLTKIDPKFPERFTFRLQPHKQSYEYKKTRPLKFEWSIDTTVNNTLKEAIIRMACEVAGLEFGKDLIINLG